MFFFRPSIKGRKEKINQFRDNVNLNPTDCSLEFMKRFSADKVDFQPHLLNSNDPEKRDLQTDLLYNFFRQIFETSNPNLIHNAHYLCATEKTKNSEIVCVGPTKQRYDSARFILLS